jgi:hypothetical protein
MRREVIVKACTPSRTTVIFVAYPAFDVFSKSYLEEYPTEGFKGSGYLIPMVASVMSMEVRFPLSNVTMLLFACAFISFRMSVAEPN